MGIAVRLGIAFAMVSVLAVTANLIVGLCRSLGLAVTAEGIETAEQLAVLLEFPSLCLQGYLISEPVRGDTLPTVLEQMPQRLQSLLLSASEAVKQPSEASEAHASLEAVPDLTLVGNAVERA
jgi:hypothetical protein